MIKTSFGVGKYPENPRLCVEEAVKNFRNPKIIFFFSGEKYFREYARLINETFPKTICIGCTAYCSMDASGFEKDVLKAVAIEDGVICSAGVIEKADNLALEYSDRVRQSLKEVGETKNTVCVEFTIPFKRAEEYALMALNSVLLRNEIPVIGGTAANIEADSGASEEAYVALNGEIYPKGCVFALIHNIEGRILLCRENIYEPLTNKSLTVTKANSITRTVMTYNDMPAADVYAEELGVTKEDIPKYFFHFPMGRREGDEVYVTAIQSESSNGSLKHLARVYEGTKMMVMKEGDFRKITDRTIKGVLAEIENPSLVMVFDCVARTILFEEKNYLDEYGKKLADAFPKIVGFSCLGEQLGTKNFNHTLMLAVFE